MSKIPHGHAGPCPLEPQQRAAYITQLNGRKLSCLAALQKLMPAPGSSLNRQRHLVRDLKAVTFERHHFARMIRKHANPSQPEIDQNLRANSALVLHEPLPPRILFAALSPVIANLRQRSFFRRTRIDSKSAPGVMQVDE